MRTPRYPRALVQALLFGGLAACGGSTVTDTPDPTPPVDTTKPGPTVQRASITARVTIDPVDVNLAHQAGQGAIIVDTRAAAAAPELAVRFDPRTTEANIVGGKAFQDSRQAITATGNVAQPASARTLSSNTTTRGGVIAINAIVKGGDSEARRHPA